jgi:hypothetical protein
MRNQIGADERGSDCHVARAIQSGRHASIARGAGSNSGAGTEIRFPASTAGIGRAERQQPQGAGPSGSLGVSC